MSELATIQKWLTSIMVRPGQLQDKIRAADANYGIDSQKLIVSSGKMNAEARIGIYARGYVLRLMECMQADYPALKHLMGDELFDLFAKAYLVQIPSHSPSLFDLGKNFPAFLQASQPKDAPHEMFALPVEMARLERMRVEVFRSEGLEKGALAFPDSDPLFYLFGAERFRTSPCLRLIELDFELVDFIRQSEKEEAAPTPLRKHNHVAICRRNYVVQMHEIEDWQWHFLKVLDECDHQGEAAEKVSEILNLPADQLSSELMLWLPVAMQRGYVWSESGLWT